MLQTNVRSKLHLCTSKGRCWHLSVSPTLVLSRLGNATASLPLRGQPRRKALRSYPAGQVRRKETHPRSSSAPPPPLRGLRERIAGTRTWQTLRAAAWLEWQSQGNWTNPWLFLLYLVVRPLTAALVLVFMYWVISGYRSHGAFFGFLIVGSAAWSFVDQVLAGLPRAVLDDREQYAMLKYVYIAPHSYITFLIGRGAPRMLAGCLSFIITLGFGISILGIPVNLLRVNYLLLLLALVPGFVAITALGIALAGISLVLKQNAWILPDAMAGALYLIAGAIFPIAILPGWLEKFALVMPLTYWLELIRRALLGETIGAVFPIASTSTIVGLLALTTSLTLIACIAIFRTSEHLARERGQIDRTTNY